MQPHVSGKVGSLVARLVGWVDHVRHCRRLSNFPEKLVVGGGTKMQRKRMENYACKATRLDMRDVGYLNIR